MVLFFSIFFFFTSFGFANTDDLDKLAGDYMCYGGGMDFKHEKASEVYTYEEFRTAYSNCEELDTPQALDHEFDNINQKILNYANENDSKNTCPEINDFLKEYIERENKISAHVASINPLRQENIFKKSQTLNSKFEKIEDISESTTAENMTIRSAALANTAVYCAASDISLKTNPMWRLKVYLLGGKFASEVEEIVESGQTSKGCANVKASGSKNLENFYVNVENADTTQPLVITYDTKSVKDQVKVSKNGSSLHDSGCVGTNGDVIQNLTLNEGDKKVKIDVGANCETGGQGGTYWEVLIQCTEKGIEPDPMNEECLRQMNELLDYIDQGVVKSKKIHNHYWMQSVCYVKSHKDFKDDYKGNHTHLKKIAVDLCKNKKCKAAPFETGKIKYTSIYFDKTTRTKKFTAKKSSQSVNNGNLKEGKASKNLQRTTKDKKDLIAIGWFSQPTKSNEKSDTTKKSSDVATISNLDTLKTGFSNLLIERPASKEQLKKLNINKDKIASKDLDLKWFKQKNLETKDLAPIKKDQDLNRKKNDKNLKKAFKEQDGLVYIDLRFFNMFKWELCTPLANAPEIFSQVSMRYCLSAYPILLPRFK